MAIRSKLSFATIERFWDKVQQIPFSTCWHWTAALNEKGYGIFGIKKETDKAHRISWKLTRGKIPKGLFVLHRCDNPACVNPDHLFLGTNLDNVRDMIAKGRNSKPPSMGGWNKIYLPPNIIAMMGKKPDREIAKSFHCSKTLIMRQRNRLGIKPFTLKTGG